MSIGKTFVNGLAQQFNEDSYDRAVLSKYIPERDFKKIMSNINDTLYAMFPCPLCFCFGYCCCPCTLGLSFLLPYVCVRDAEREMRDLLHKINLQILHERKLHLDLVI